MLCLVSDGACIFLRVECELSNQRSFGGKSTTVGLLQLYTFASQRISYMVSCQYIGSVPIRRNQFSIYIVVACTCTDDRFA
jgi:hypothetical protein